MKKIAIINESQCDRSPFCPVKRVCPQDAITQEGKLFSAKAPKVDPNKCTGCGTCVRYCPHGAVTLKQV